MPDAVPNDQPQPDSAANASVETPPADGHADEAPLSRGLPRVVSIIVLLAVVLLIGVLFFRVMATFLVPLFLAAVLTVVCEPLHHWMRNRLVGRKQLAALLTTLLISFIVVVPTGLMGWMSYVETMRIVRVALAGDDSPEALTVGVQPLTQEEDAAVEAEQENPPAEETNGEQEADDPQSNTAEEADEVEEEAPGWTQTLVGWARPWTDWYQTKTKTEIDFEKLGREGARYVVQFGLVGVQTVFGFLFGMAIMIFALYYFFADGPSIIETLMHLSPLDDDYERELLSRFAQVSRAVVLATILSAVVQGLLAGVGYYFVLQDWAPEAVASQYDSFAEIPEADLVHPPLFLLTVATMLLAIVPFVGATAVWIPVVAWVYFVQGDLWPAIGMGVYGAAVVSSIDNVIKPYVLHGQSNLHPLLALLSVLGGIQLLGPIGILVGPMLVAFMQALLEMLKKELDSLQADSQRSPEPVSSA